MKNYAKFNSNGTIYIPKAIRITAGIKPGTKVRFIVSKGKIILEVIVER
ncbi:MAG TPA: AbrB/MazE/SpoVT family DNA-binding domain-containing protein [Patescibacteria group bacterium]|nr:AbrB/MazE/SpoVT family DNA-binding domain-containing protein [Patescibacteria group bacterium]